ncbi:MAG: ABC transporter permease [Acidobacteria bacterium]|nr:ABC transporter permease [Acidobacteriota bacterium]
MSFETFVALRYLRAKSRERFVSLVTVLSAVGVATGVAALVIALAINNGVEQDLQRYLLGATAHVRLLEKSNSGIENWREFIAEFDDVEGVAAAAPALWGEVMVSTPVRSGFAYLKGIDIERELDVVGMLNDLKEGSVSDLDRADDYPGIILGKDLAEHIGARLETVVTIINPQGEMTPFGPITSQKRFRVAGVMDSGFFLYDNQWAVATLTATQQALNVGDVISGVEFKLDDLDKAEPVAERLEAIAGSNFGTTNWKEENRSLFQALEVEKLVTAITIGLIMLVAALNILTSLVMMVMEKRKGIAILKSLGASAAQVRKIFVLQGMIIGAAGTAVGLVLGHILALVCNAHKLIPLDAAVYGLSHVPFAPRLIDGILVGVAALLMSYLTTLYPSSSATRIAPAHVLRYE